MWQQADIAGKTADVFVPSQRRAGNFAVLFLHGHGLLTLRDNAVYTGLFERFGLACVCPHGKRSWWGDRICREFDSRITPVAFLRESLTPWMEANLQAAPPAIALLGVS